ncbi:MAG TPA: hypothetical protein VF814_15670 [Casimicrobiaceae bacterium]
MISISARPIGATRGDFLRRDEGFDIDRPGRLHIRPPEILLGEHDVAILVVFVALDNVAPGNLLAALLAVALVADQREIALVEHRELELLALLGRKELDRDIDEPEVDRTFPEGTGHDLFELYSAA